MRQHCAGEHQRAVEVAKPKVPQRMGNFDDPTAASTQRVDDVLPHAGELAVRDDEDPGARIRPGCRLRVAADHFAAAALRLRLL
jgi:hypothetical protein